MPTRRLTAGITSVAAAVLVRRGAGLLRSILHLVSPAAAVAAAMVRTVLLLALFCVGADGRTAAQNNNNLAGLCATPQPHARANVHAEQHIHTTIRLSFYPSTSRSELCCWVSCTYWMQAKQM